MSMIWWFVPWFPDDPALARLGQHCRFTNNEEMVRARSGAQTFSPINFPTARLELTLEKFSLGWRRNQCWNWLGGDLQWFEVIGSCGEVNGMRRRLFGKSRPAVDLSHHDLP
jgi:hypothetical protein